MTTYLNSSEKDDFSNDSQVGFQIPIYPLLVVPKLSPKIKVYYLLIAHDFPNKRDSKMHLGLSGAFKRKPTLLKTRKGLMHRKGLI
jgi:hypothetical protein